MTARNPWALRLRRIADLSADDERLLDGLISNPKRYRAREDVIREGENPTHALVIVEGAACRYKILADGRRQITSFLLPGDISDLHMFLFRRMDHSIGALVPSRVAAIPREVVIRITEERPQLTRALWWSTLLDTAIMRAWIVSIGRRTAYERIAHLLWELYLRLEVVGEVGDPCYRLPITQAELADTLGLSVVHVNRNLRRLQREGLIEVERRRLVIRDVDGLKDAGQFDPAYLHQMQEAGGPGDRS